MSGGVSQKKPKGTAYIDEELMGHKGRRAFKSAAYSLGIAVGFLILSPILPEIGDAAQHDAVMSIFRGVAFWMIGYSLAVGATFFFFRAHVKTVLTLLNWFVMPVVAITAFLHIKDILTGGA